MRILSKLGFVAFIFLFGICSCGNENRNLENPFTGNLDVRLIFPDTLSAMAKNAPFLSTHPPYYVRIKVFDAEEEELITETDVIPIGEGEATLSDIPVGIVTVRAEGLDKPDGDPMYAGEESGVEVKANEITTVTIYLSPISE